MYIHEIIVEGFKSYAQRTVIAGFDPHFNAITGLNGSGKSNILDSICFVLGISNLSQVRVGNLQELVYKQGQAGVTKASVSIVFNNEDPSKSPIGYEQHRQITRDAPDRDRRAQQVRARAAAAAARRRAPPPPPPPHAAAAPPRRAAIARARGHCA